ALVLVEGHVQHPVHRPDPPVASDQPRHLLGRPGVAADVVVARRHARPAHLAAAHHLHHRLRVRPAPRRPLPALEHPHPPPPPPPPAPPPRGGGVANRPALVPGLPAPGKNPPAPPAEGPAGCPSRPAGSGPRRRGQPRRSPSGSRPRRWSRSPRPGPRPPA